MVDDEISQFIPNQPTTKGGIVIKTPEQINGIRKSSKITAQILKELNDIIKPGITTLDIDEYVFNRIRQENARPATLGYKGYPSSCCTSINEVICHGIPEARVLKDGDIVNVDVTTILNGYYGDACSMYSVGDISETAQKLVTVTKECLDRAIEQVKPGNTFGDSAHAIQSHAEANGFSVVKAFCGHGIGMAFHEPPQVLHYGKPMTGPKYEPGMVFTIEPMINEGTYHAVILEDGWTAVTKDRLLSAQWEHTLLVTSDGVEILTR